MPDPPLNPSAYYSFRQWMVDHYRVVLYRVPLDLGFGCPHRADDGSGGCVFCPADGGRASQIQTATTLEEQIAQGIDFARERYRAREFMAYVQAFTGTFAPRSEQRRLVERILERFPFRAISVGTRPDCLAPAVVETLCEWKEEVDVWVELGVQSAHDRTLRAIRRGHSWAQSRDAVKRLHEAGLRTAVHLITGLPGETRGDLRATAEAVAALPVDGVKIHNLHVLRGTELAEWHAKRPLDLPDEYVHAEMVMDILERIPANVAVMRLQTDSGNADRIAPNWTMSKGRFLDFVEQQMELRQFRQGDRTDRPRAISQSTSFGVETTADGSTTFWNASCGEHYHAPPGALSEARTKYVGAARLAERLRVRDMRLLDVCFGLGYNSLAAAEAALEAPHSLDITALEADRRVVRAAADAIDWEIAPMVPWRKVLVRLHQQGEASFANVAIGMMWGDARYCVRRLRDEGDAYDAVFLDPFSTQRNSELWTVDFFRRLRAVMRPDGVLLTYSTARPVLAGLREAGFCVALVESVGPHRPATIASLDASKVQGGLPADVVSILRSTSGGIPYRDPSQTATNRDILRARQAAVLKWKEKQSTQ